MTPWTIFHPVFPLVSETGGPWSQEHCALLRVPVCLVSPGWSFQKVQARAGRWSVNLESLGSCSVCLIPQFSSLSSMPAGEYGFAVLAWWWLYHFQNQHVIESLPVGYLCWPHWWEGITPENHRWNQLNSKWSPNKSQSTWTDAMNNCS